MASNYGRNFGFRVSDETRRSSNGRFRTPVGSALLLGTAVEINPSSAGYLQVGGSGGVKPRTGTCGLLVQEEAWDRSIYQSDLVDSFQLGTALPNTQSVITNGPGTKVWFKNTGAVTRADGRVIPAVAMFTVTSVAVGRGLAWNGTVWVDVADPTAATSFMEVTYYDSNNAYVEAILTH
jgi:hypothetical protein